MDQPFEQFGFFIELTKDLSPTLRQQGGGESMHHSAGAAAETRYIYKQVIKQAIQILGPLSTVVVGLGLGYIEISWAQVVYELGLEPNALMTLDSFESNEALRKQFYSWFMLDKHLATQIIYDQLNEHLQPGSPVDAIQKILKINFLKSGKLAGDFISDRMISSKWNVICYDLFSQKTTINLWEEDFLCEFIKVHCAADCVFTTYASTKSLKNVLFAAGFLLLERPGFANKRESTLAVRGRFKDDSVVFQTF